MFAAEGQAHKLQRRVATPSFSIQNMRALVPLALSTGERLKNKLMEIIASTPAVTEKVHPGAKIDVCRWVSRATFNLIGSAGARASPRQRI